MKLLRFHSFGKAFAKRLFQAMLEPQSVARKTKVNVFLTFGLPAIVSNMGRSLVLALGILGIHLGMAAQSSVRIGSPDIPALSSDSVWVPIFATQLSGTEVKKFTFTFVTPSSGVKLMGITSLVETDFSLVIDSSKGSFERTLTFTAKAAGFSQSSLKIAELLFQPEAANLPVTISYQDGYIEEDKNQTIPVTQCRLTSGSVSRADINQDGQIDLLDYAAEYQAITSTLYYQRNANAHDFSGKNPTGAMDVAILRQHILGLHPVLLPPSVDTNQTQRSNVVLSLSPPSAIGGGYFRYVIQGTQLQGLLAGEMALDIDATVFSSISAVTSPVNGDANADIRAVLGNEDSRKPTLNQVHLFYVGTEALTASNLEMIELTVKHRSGATGNAFKGIASAYLNEGLIGSNVLSKANGSSHETATVARFLPKAIQREWILTSNGIRLPWNGKAGTISLMDGRGRVLWSKDIQIGSSRIEIPTHEVKLGIAIHLQSEGQSYTLRLPSVNLH